MTSLFRTFAAIVVAAMGLLTACGGDGDTAPVSSSTSAPTTVAPTTAPPSTTPPPATTNSTAPATSSKPPVPGDTFNGEDMTPAQANVVQQSVDDGHQPWRLDAKTVAEAFVLGRFGWNDVDCELADPHTAEVINRTDGRMVVLQLRQPAREGEGGIWAVVSGVWVR